MAQREGVVDVGDERISKLLWEKYKNESAFALYSPFIVCLASDKLDPNVFSKFISQDLHVLHAFDEALYWAKECLDNEEEKNPIGALQQEVKHRLKFYNDRVREWGFELKRQKKIWSTIASYTEFLSDVALGKIKGVTDTETPFGRTKFAAYILAAMAPWMRLYASISKEIQRTDESRHPCKKWVDDHCSQDFEAFAMQIEDLLDRLSISLTDEELNAIETLYLQALEHQVEFLATQPVAQRSVLPLSLLRDPADTQLLLFCDFDIACSTVCTSSILAKIAVETAKKVDTHRPDSRLTGTSSTDLRRTWKALAARHAEERNHFLDSIIQSETEIFNYEGVCKALEQVADFQKKSNSRIIEFGALKGISLEDINRSGKRLPLQDGCKEFFQRIVNSEKLKSSVHVLSYCWCGDLIKSTFSLGDPNVLDVLKVHSNELAYEGSFSTGEIIRIVESPAEKHEVCSKILKDCGTNGKPFTVYIGGSMSDLLCLLEADIGIVMGSSTSLRKLGNHFGISFVPLFSGVINKQKELAPGDSSIWKGLQGTLYTVSSWDEIHAFILGP